MVDKLGIPRTEMSLDDEILPRRDYPQAPSNAPELPAPSADQVTIDIDDEGNIKQPLATRQPLAAVPIAKYYAVQLKIIGVPRSARSIAGMRSAGRLSDRKDWSGRHLGMR